MDHDHQFCSLYVVSVPFSKSLSFSANRKSGAKENGLLRAYFDISSWGCFPERVYTNLGMIDSLRSPVLAGTMITRGETGKGKIDRLGQSLTKESLEGLVELTACVVAHHTTGVEQLLNPGHLPRYKSFRLVLSSE